ncbi:hypothetical protein G7066_08725 [Leucobacter coleopterorum]|uniref:Sulfate permease n=1 Tax=Leucobacter coleopterorum TaxID=2714933 RepID=A0ABX6K0R9_9MICO|nr:hypothetical protein [Leucobacter coleopterorum]QIM18674.1 hypothetical protein G7066_08725 [Leucobacter coleopterorum]
MLLNIVAALSIGTFNLLKKYAPSNRLLRDLCQRADRFWSLRVSLYALPYLFGAWLIRIVIETGGPEWAHILFAILFWNTMKFLPYWPVDMVRRLVARIRRAGGKTAGITR